MTARGHIPACLLVILLALSVFILGTGRAQSSDASSSGAETSGSLALTVGEGRLLQLNRTVRNVFVGDAAIADVQVVNPRELYVYGRKPGETTLTASDTDSGIAAQVTLDVSRGAGQARAALPPNTALRLQFHGSELVITGRVDTLKEALATDAAVQAYNPSKLPPLDQTRLPGAQQVTLRVRIAEVSRSTMNQLGINFNAVAHPGSFTFGLVTGSFLGANASSILGTTPSTDFGQASVGVSSRRVNGQALLDALQSEGLINALAEPNLTTISGETAKFMAGGEIPIPVPQALGVTTIDYKKYGVRLEFTPVLLPDDRIALKVHPQVSEISNANSVTISGVSVPSFIERETETQVEMASGQTLAISGLFQRNEQNSITKFPGLGDLPVLGALFRSVSYQRSETELVVLVTPYLSQPVSNPDAFASPYDLLAGSRPSATNVAAGFVAN